MKPLMINVPIMIIKKTDSQIEQYDSLLDSFSNKQYCNGGVDGLQTLEKSAAYTVIIEADNTDMTGIEIAEAIRDIDYEGHHFTYIVILGGDVTTELQDAFGNFVDAHITTAMQRTLPLAVKAGCRLSQQINSARELISELSHSNLELQKDRLLDPVTGLGNRRFAERSLVAAIKQVASRGGAICFLIISVRNYNEIIKTYDKKIANDLIQLVSEKIQHLVRPADTVTYFGPGEFALILIQPSIKHCTAKCYERIFDGVRLKSFKTAAGFLRVDIAMSICASSASEDPPEPNEMIAFAQNNLDKAFKRGTIAVHHISSME